MTWLIFIAATLACFRLTRLITDDKIFDWLRRLVVREAPRKLKQKAKQGITCPFCVSFYYSVLITVGLAVAGVIPWMWVLYWQPAVWGGSVLWNQVFVKLSE
jgi:Protein of unknown function (DUF1360)